MTIYTNYKKKYMYYFWYTNAQESWKEKSLKKYTLKCFVHYVVWLLSSKCLPAYVYKHNEV